MAKIKSTSEATIKTLLVNAFDKSESKTVTDICRITGVALQTYYYHTKTDKEFKRQMILGAAQSPTRRLLEKTRLSNLPELPRRSACANCGGSLDTTDQYQMTVKLCRGCLINYANIGAILETHTAQKIRKIYRGGANE